MKITPVESGIILTNGYLVADEQSGKAVVIDTPLDSCELYLELLSENHWKLEAILLTHSHWDHTADAARLKEAAGVDIYLHQDDEYRLINPKEYSILPLDFELESAKADKYLSNNTLLKFGDLRFDTLHTPGHTEGSVSFVMPEHKIVFTGDTLFSGSIGRTDLPGGDYESILISIANKLMVLPDDYQVLSGHGPVTTIGRERESNPFIINNLRI